MTHHRGTLTETCMMVVLFVACTVAPSYVFYAKIKMRKLVQNILCNLDCMALEEEKF